MRKNKGLHRALTNVFSFLLFATPGLAQGNLRCAALEIKPSTQAKYFAAHPDDLERAKCMLDFYARRLLLSDLRTYRIALIRWVITHDPGINLENYLDQGLDVGTEAIPDYAEIRALWHKQVKRRPTDPAVLSNAGRALSIADREQALRWLKYARTLSPQDTTIPKRLADLYSYAISGVAGTGPELNITRVDISEQQSSFARLAFREAEEDSNIAALTGLKLHYMSRWPFFRSHQLDYDKQAETLLLKAAALDYPHPTKISALAAFYFDQRGKASGSIYSEAPTVERSSDEMMKRLTTPELLQAGNARPSLSVRVKIVVGVDGHVQSASAIDPPTKQSGLMAAYKAKLFSFLPLRVDENSVQVRTELTVMVEEAFVN
ncbi:MAG TPA: hypothetical protein VK638_05530 [Edaphobacter sp.]|nr:hypothetical protein [Edaphobacter sp.]